MLNEISVLLNIEIVSSLFLICFFVGVSSKTEIVTVVCTYRFFFSEFWYRYRIENSVNYLYRIDNGVRYDTDII